MGDLSCDRPNFCNFYVRQKRGRNAHSNRPVPDVGISQEWHDLTPNIRTGLQLYLAYLHLPTN
jgi:hypothetical protein